MLTDFWTWLDTNDEAAAAACFITILLGLFLAAYAGDLLGWWEHEPVDDDPQTEYCDAADRSAS